jgi:hypothetical protein
VILYLDAHTLHHPARYFFFHGFTYLTAFVTLPGASSIACVMHRNNKCALLLYPRSLARTTVKKRARPSAAPSPVAFPDLCPFFGFCSNLTRLLPPPPVPEELDFGVSSRAQSYRRSWVGTVRRKSSQNLTGSAPSQVGPCGRVGIFRAQPLIPAPDG